MRIRDFVHGAWRKMPVEAAIVAMAGLGAIGAFRHGDELWFARLVLAGVLVMPLAFASHRLGVRRQATVISAVTAAVLAALAVTLRGDTRPDSPAFSYPFGLCALASLLVPFVAARRQFTHFVRRFFEETTTWGLLWGVAMTAIGIVAYALHALFDLDVEHLGLDVVITVVTAAFVLVYLDRLRTAEIASPGRMPELWRRLATTIGAPFVCVMLAILVAYELSVVVQGAMPRNTLSPLILGAGFAGFLSTLIVASVLGEAAASPLVPADRHAWARGATIRVMRGFPIVLLALLPMAGWALWLRIDEHGLTPLRVVRAYGLLCLAVLSVAGAWRCVRRRDALTWQVPAVILVGALVAAVGPLSAVRLSVRSQADALARTLDELGIDRVVATEVPGTKLTLNWDRFLPFARRFELVFELGGEAGLRRALTGDLSACGRAGGWSCLEHLGVRELGEASNARPAPAYQESTQLSVRTQTGTMIFVEAWRDAGAPAPSAAEIASREATAEGVVLTAEEVVVYRNGARRGAASFAELLAQANLAAPSALPVVSADGAVLGELAIHKLGVHHADDHDEVVAVLGTLLLRD